LNDLRIILKSGFVINIQSKSTTKDILANMSIEPGKCVNIGESFIVCSEIAAVMDVN
jgi:hypothetical protein